MPKEVPPSSHRRGQVNSSESLGDMSKATQQSPGKQAPRPVLLPCPFPMKWWGSDRLTQGFPGGSDDKESACTVGDSGLISGLGKIPWGREWQPMLVFLPGQSHGQRSLAGYSPWGCKESDTTEMTNGQPTAGIYSCKLISLKLLIFGVIHTPWIKHSGVSGLHEGTAKIMVNKLESVRETLILSVAAFYSPQV